MRITNKLRLIATTSLTLTLALMAAHPAAARDALPTGGTVVAGSATIGGQANGAQTITQTSNRAVIDWTSFNVGQGNSLTFVQPNADGATLNRVTGTTASTIAGQITANGSVYLVNPNGIQITKSGVINAGRGFVASTLDISNAEFIAGAGQFKGTGGAIDNQGSITVGTGGVVGLLGGSVSSSGLILAPAGKVVIGAVTYATLDLNGDGFLQVALPDQAALAQDGSAAVVSAQSSYDATRNTVNLDGVSATTITGSNGDVVLSGRISVDSASGDAGSITVMGNNTRASGELSARATGSTGNGGLIETSGNTVDFTGLSVDTTAAHGATGTWLVDPTDLTIDAAAAATIQSNLATSNVTLQTNLDGTTSGAGVTSTGAGDIIVASAISWSANTLTLNAANDIKVQAVLTASGSAGLALNYGDTKGVSSTTPITGAGLDFGLTSDGFTGRVDFTGLGNSLSINGNAYTIITSLGAAGSTTGTDLQGINGNLTGYYALGADIDASATSGWNSGQGFDPLGATDASGGSGGFTGAFTGLGHTVSNLWVNRPSATYAGLFGYAETGSSIGQVGVIDATVSANGANGGTSGNSDLGGAGGDGGTAGALVGMAYGSITQSYATGTVSANGGDGGYGNITAGPGGAGGTAGGLVGVSNGAITESYATVSVSANGGNGGEAYRTSGAGGAGGMAGGLVGFTTADITESYATGAVSANGGNGGRDNQNATGVAGAGGSGGIAGGLAGMANGGVIARSYATGSVSVNGGVGGYNNQVMAAGAGGQGGWAGGLAGSAGSAVIQSYATGTVSANGGDGGGGSGGAANGGRGGLAGGLTGANSNDVTQSYATGSVSANSGSGSSGGADGAIGTVGGLTGRTYAGTIKLSYWDRYGTGQASGVGANLGATVESLVALTSDPMQSAAADYIYNASAWSMFATGGTSDIDTVGGQALAWRMYDGFTLPMLKAFLRGGTVAVNVGDATATYNGYVQQATPTVTAPGSVDLGQILISGQGRDVGQYATDAYSTQQGYDLVVTAGTLTITPKTLIILGYTDTAVYDASIHTNNFATGGLVASDTVTAVSGLASGTDAGRYRDNLSGAIGSGLSNYNITYINGVLTITPAPLTVTGNTGSSLYSGSAQTNGFTTSGLIGSDTVTAVAGLASGTNVGSYVDSLSGATGSGVSNYAITYVNGGLTITPRALTVTGSSTSSVYNGAVQTNAFTTSGLVGSDTVTSVTGLAGGTNVGTYVDTLSGATGSGLSNYTVTYVNGGLAITPRALTVTGTNASIVYDGAVHTNAFTTNGLVGSDTVTAVAGRGGGTNAGTYADTLSGATGSGLSNYTITYVNGGLVITPRAIVVIADAQHRAPGMANPALTWTVGGLGLVGGDTLSGALATPADETSIVGDYAITQGTLAASSNYAMTFVEGILSVRPASMPPSRVAALNAVRPPMFVSGGQDMLPSLVAVSFSGTNGGGCQAQGDNTTTNCSGQSGF